MIKTKNKENGFFKRLWANIKLIGTIFVKGDFLTKLSFIVMGSGALFRGQIVKGLALLGLEAAFIRYMMTYGVTYTKDLFSLGTAVKKQVWDESAGIYRYVQGDNSMLILLFSVLTICIAIAFLALYFVNLKVAYNNQLKRKEGKKLPNIIQDFKALLDDKFHITMLTLPGLGVMAFTVFPLIFMVLLAFTNFDSKHQPPGNLFTWVGFENFKAIFWEDPQKSQTFLALLIWTLVWAFFATFTNYILGTILAMMINKKGIKLKKMWRSIFVITIAVPQFVSLLLMSKLFADLGPVNVLLQQWGWITSPIPFWTNPVIAKVMLIVVNMWVGIPFSMLITTGVLMNIPEDLYESARIDGANPIVMFMKITMPYLLFVTTPYLITQFIGNINNFNVIYLLNQGNPLSLDYFQAGKTDLLVTWLYKQTVDKQNYNLASTIGIMVFVICATLSLITYNMSGSVKREEEFQ